LGAALKYPLNKVSKYGIMEEEDPEFSDDESEINQKKINRREHQRNVLADLEGWIYTMRDKPQSRHKIVKPYERELIDKAKGLLYGHKLYDLSDRQTRVLKDALREIPGRLQVEYYSGRLTREFGFWYDQHSVLSQGYHTKARSVSAKEKDKYQTEIRDRYLNTVDMFQEEEEAEYTAADMFQDV